MAEFTVTSDLPEWLQSLRDESEPVARAAVAALRETAANAVAEGRRDIAGAGRFGAKWQSGLRYRTTGAGTKGEKPSLDAEATIFHSYGFAAVFEYGATIQGKPLLWIPTTPGGPAPKKSGKKLVSATVNGRPMLFDAGDHDRHRKPLYIGVKQVREPKLFHITEIVEKHADRLTELFIKHFEDGE
jgi:hypothetical protein